MDGDLGLRCEWLVLSRGVARCWMFLLLMCGRSCNICY
ncbi:unnamed protein product [Rhodiola kirilowii]